ncbi:MAG: 4-hydroxy-3-methylbut-2-enyl diphosphate reductase [Glaciecola sp.]|jgi:4-hydroxy-3-methylbut-2-enyl diphosphate reductase
MSDTLKQPVSIPAESNKTASGQITTIKLANPRGFCAGVDRAIDIVNRALDIFGEPIYVRHEVVHNKFVVETLRSRGAVFVEELSDIPLIDRTGRNSVVVFSAHGVAQSVKDDAQIKGFQVFDATCPLVTKVHMEVIKFGQGGRECVLIGHQNHPEVDGTMGQYDNSFGGKIYLVESVEDVLSLTVENPEKLSYVTQTTLSMDDTSKVIDALGDKFPGIEGPRKKDICYATQNRQDAVKQLALECDLLLVVGSPNSSNSNRLKELAERLGCESYLIDSVQGIDEKWLAGKHRFGVTAGASAPEVLVQQVIAKLEDLAGVDAAELNGVKEDIVFSMPKELR